MTVVKWRYKDGEVMTNCHIFKWLCISMHFKGVSMWGAEWHFKDSNTTHHIFSKHVSKTHVWSCSRLTFRFGKPIITIGIMDLEDYYHCVEILKVVGKAKIKPNPQRSKEYQEYLNKAYPDKNPEQ